MKTIGLLGGMSWESTAHYYAILNRAVRDRRGHAHSARIVMVSVDFAQTKALQHAGEWDELGRRLAADARRIEDAGADCLLIATNTMHMLADEVQTAISIPLLHIADATGAAIQTAGLSRVGLLGTAFTMEKPFYRERLKDRFGIEAIVPEAEERAEIHRVIFDELIGGVIRPESRDTYLAIVDGLAARGAEGVVLGCTEIMMLIGQPDVAIPVFDTTEIHAMAAVEFALSNSSDSRQGAERPVLRS